MPLNISIIYPTGSQVAEVFFKYRFFALALLVLLLRFSYANRNICIFVVVIKEVLACKFYFLDKQTPNIELKDFKMIEHTSIYIVINPFNNIP